MPPISIIIPCYNYAAYIGETLASIEGEIGKEDEVIIIDDGSTDQTQDIVGKWIEGKPSFSYYSQENSGPAAARNAGLDQAKNPYAYLLDADDRPLPGRLNVLKQTADAHPEAAMIIGGHMTFDASGKEKTHPVGSLSVDREKNFVAYAIKKDFGIANGGCVLIKTGIARKYRYPEQLHVSEDICFYSWVLANHPCVTFDEIILKVRKHENSLRHRVDLYEKVVGVLPEVLFASKHMPSDFRKYQEAFEQHLLLSLFRAQFNARKKKEARATYLQALREKPALILDWSYFSKFVRTLFS